VKAKLQDHLDIPADKQRLVFAGRQLGDDMTLNDSGVQVGATLHMVLPTCGGAPVPFADVSNSSSLQSIPFFAKAPRYVVVWRIFLGEVPK